MCKKCKTHVTAYNINSTAVFTLWLFSCSDSKWHMLLLSCFIRFFQNFDTFVLSCQVSLPCPIQRPQLEFYDVTERDEEPDGGINSKDGRALPQSNCRPKFDSTRRGGQYHGPWEFSGFNRVQPSVPGSCFLHYISQHRPKKQVECIGLLDCDSIWYPKLNPVIQVIMLNEATKTDGYLLRLQQFCLDVTALLTAIIETVEESKLTWNDSIGHTNSPFTDGQHSPAYGLRKAWTDSNESKPSS